MRAMRSSAHPIRLLSRLETRTSARRPRMCRGSRPDEDRLRWLASAAWGSVEPRPVGFGKTAADGPLQMCFPVLAYRWLCITRASAPKHGRADEIARGREPESSIGGSIPTARQISTGAVASR